MQMQLNTPSQTRQAIRGKLRTGNWWLLIPVGESGRDICRYIEDKYYSGKKNADFHIILGTHPEHGTAAVFLAAKKHLPMSALKRLYLEGDEYMIGRTDDAEPLEYPEGRNVILFSSAHDELTEAKVFAEAKKAVQVFGLEAKDL